MILSICRWTIRVSTASVLVILTAPFAVAQPDPALKPSYGSVTLKAGFTPDPHVKVLTAGGPVKTALGGVNAFVAKAPDYQLNYTKGSYPLIFRVESKGDTTLLVRLPDGRWVANDDGKGLKPVIHLTKPDSGRYDIYVGTVKPGNVPATLSITEILAPTTTPPTPTWLDALGVASRATLQADLLNKTDQKIFGNSAKGNTLTFFLEKGIWKQTFLVASNDSHLVVAFRGSKYDILLGNTELQLVNKMLGKTLIASDTIINPTTPLHKVLNGESPFVLGTPGPWPKFGEVITHAGWSTAANEAFDMILPELKKQGAEKKTVIICGHSMGGAVAGYVTYRLLRDTDLFQGSRKHRLVTFGAPRFAASQDLDVLSFPKKFQSLATSKSLLAISIEMNGDPHPRDWLDKTSTPLAFGQRIGLAGVYRLGNTIDTWTKDSDKHSFANYHDALNKSQVCDYVRLVHKGAYYAKFHMSWTRPDGVAEEYHSGQTTAGWSEAVPVPRGCTKLRLHAQAAVFIATWRNILLNDITPGTYVVGGTTLDRTWRKE